MTTSLDIFTSTYTDTLFHSCIFLLTTVASFYMIQVFFFTASPSEQDQYYLRGNVTKMVKLVGKPVNVGGKFFKYRLELYDEKVSLGADMQKVALSFEYVSDQDIEYDPKTSGRYPVEDLNQKGYFEVIEKEGSDIDRIFRRNLDKGEEEEFELSIKGPYGNLKYIGNGSFYK
jgi:hypothetical protein